MARIVCSSPGRFLRQRRLPATDAHRLQDLDHGVVVEQHVTLRRLIEKLFKRRLDALRLVADDAPLRRGRQGNPRFACNFSARWNGVPAPCFSRAIMLPTVASRFLSPTPTGGAAVNS